MAEDAGVELPVGEASNAGGQPSGTGVAAKAGVQYSAKAQIKNSIPFMRSLIVFLRLCYSFRLTFIVRCCIHSS